MHELGIARSILKTVTDEKSRLGLDDIVGVTVRIGALSGVLPDALEFGFDALRKDSEVPDCKLYIEHVSVSYLCKSCGATTTVDEADFQCVSCGSADTEMINGFELDITNLDVR